MLKEIAPTRVSTIVHGAIPYCRHGYRAAKVEEEKKYAEEIFPEDSSAVIDSCDIPEDREKPVEMVVDEIEKTMSESETEETKETQAEPKDEQVLEAPAPKKEKKKSSKKKSE